MQENIRITSASLKALACNYKYEQEIQPGSTDELNCKSKLPYHIDLKKAFDKLDPHLAAICEEVTPDEIGDIDNLPEYDSEDEDNNSPLTKKLHNFSVTAFNIEGDGDNIGVVLSGSKRLSTGDEVGLTTPKIKFEDTTYRFVNELRIQIDEVIDEVMEYKNGKRAPKVDEQPGIEFQEETEE